MDIFWSDLAKGNLKEIHEFYCLIANKKVANMLIKKLIACPEVLIDHPEMGILETHHVAIGREFRFLIEGNFKIVYKVFQKEDKILIATVFDTRRDPNKFKI